MNTPATVHIRPPRPDEASAVAHLHDTCWRATYTGLMPPEALARSTLAIREALWVARLALPTAERCAHIAETATGQLVGCAWGGPEESGDPTYRGELLGLYLLPAWQRRGLGRRLLGAVAADLHRQGQHPILLWALAENASARAFYQALGGQFLRARRTLAHRVTLSEVAYAWPDTTTLLQRTAPEVPAPHRP